MVIGLALSKSKLISTGRFLLVDTSMISTWGKGQICLQRQTQCPTMFHGTLHDNTLLRDHGPEALPGGIIASGGNILGEALAASLIRSPG